MIRNMQDLDMRDKEHLRCSVNSYLGVLSHSCSYNIRRELFLNSKVSHLMEFDADLLKGKLKSDLQTIIRTTIKSRNYEQNLWFDK